MNSAAIHGCTGLSADSSMHLIRCSVSAVDALIWLPGQHRLPRPAGSIWASGKIDRRAIREHFQAELAMPRIAVESTTSG
jgi:hypothetical protein